MADKHGLNYNVRELKLGASFTNNKASQYHTIKYDFKPASVDVNKMATVDVGTNNQVTVTVPHLDGAGVPHTVFKGSQRPYTKECVLIIDHVTGEITLERLSSNIQVKKTRQEASAKPRPLTPVAGAPLELTNTTARSSSRTRVATNRRGASHQPHNPAAGSAAATATGAGAAGGSQARFAPPPAHKTPPTMVRSPARVKTSPPQAPWSAGGNSTLASLPMIGFDEAPAPAPPAHPPHPPHPPPQHNGYAAAAPPSRADHYRPAERMERAAPAAERSQPPTERSQPALERGQPALERNQQPPSLPTVAGLAATVRAEASSSSSSSDSDSGSGSGSGSGSDSDDDAAPPPPRLLNGGSGGGSAALPRDVLNDDLCLSESGSESD